MRPSSDRVREALFARLPALEGLRVLDLYAGTGALGVEALSRGAASALFVERAPRSAAVLRENLARLELAGVSRVRVGDALAVLRRLAREGLVFDLVFLDPPYESGELARTLPALAAGGLLREGALVVVEHARHHALTAPPGLAALDERRYGDTTITRLVATGARPTSGGTATR